MDVTIHYHRQDPQGTIPQYEHPPMNVLDELTGRAARPVITQVPATRTKFHATINDEMHPDEIVGQLDVHAPKAIYDMQPTPNGKLFGEKYTPPTINVAQVDDQYQRQGIATTMLRAADQHFAPHKVQHSDEISGPAHAWATATGGKIKGNPQEATGETWGVSDLAKDDWGLNPRTHSLDNRALAKPKPVNRNLGQQFHQPSLPGV